MVDHRTEDDGDFRLFVNTNADEQVTWAERIARARAWLFEARSIRKIQDRSAGFLSGSADSEFSGTTRIALIATVVWVLALGAYGLGFYFRLDSGQAGARVLPTMDLLFFAFAIAGPVAMLWIVVTMLARTAQLTSSIADQTDSALTLAATLTNLNESIDALSAGTTGRLEQACDRMERETSASSAAMERKLIEITSKLETTLLDSVVHLDQHVNKRMEKLEIDVAQHQQAFDDRLADDARHLALTIGAEVDALRKLRGDLVEKVDTGLTESRLRIERAGEDVLSGQTAALEEIGSRLDASVRTLSGDLKGGAESAEAMMMSRLEDTARKVEATLGELSSGLVDGHNMQAAAIRNEHEQQNAALAEISKRFDATTQKLFEHLRTGSETTAGLVKARLEETAKQVHASLGELSSRMLDAQDMQSTTIRRDLVEPVQTLKASIEATQQLVASNPPASPQALADLLGGAAQHLISDERQVLDQAAAQIALLERQASEMLVRIDRAGRLNAALGHPGSELSEGTEPEAEVVPVELPFDSLPRTAVPVPLNWSAVVSTLDGADPQPNLRTACERAARHPDVARLMEFYEHLVEQLAQERVYPEDLKPEHAAAPFWTRFGQGERGGDISSLAGISDDITNAIVRSRLRNNPEFLHLSYRFVDAYVRLIEHASREIGPDHRVVEMAETGPGRCFMLLAGLLGAFEHKVALPADTGFEHSTAANQTGRPSFVMRF